MSEIVDGNVGILGFELGIPDTLHGKGRQLYHETYANPCSTGNWSSCFLYFHEGLSNDDKIAFKNSNDLLLVIKRDLEDKSRSKIQLIRGPLHKPHECLDLTVIYTKDVGSEGARIITLGLYNPETEAISPTPLFFLQVNQDCTSFDTWSLFIHKDNS